MSALSAEIDGFIRSEDASEGEFDRLALALFAYQYARNLPYHRLCDARGITSDIVRNWREIPAAPASAFKRFSLSCAPVDDCAPDRAGRVFHSSGTTGAETSRHFLDSNALAIYETSLRTGFQRAVPGAASLFALMPPVSLAPDSSLSYMLHVLVSDRGGAFLWSDDPGASLTGLLQSSDVQKEPLVVFGTAFAFMNLFDSSPSDRFALPEGSKVVETGGFKGRSREVSREELYGLLCERFGVSDSDCFSEYGMSELASQFYSVGIRGRKVGPPWVRTRTIDPVTGSDSLPGQPGLLCHYDLANVNSVLAVQTEDLGVLHSDGSFELLGRAPGAVLRGCSLLAENGIF